MDTMHASRYMYIYYNANIYIEIIISMLIVIQIAKMQSLFYFLVSYYARRLGTQILQFRQTIKNNERAFALCICIKFNRVLSFSN